MEAGRCRLRFVPIDPNEKEIIMPETNDTFADSPPDALTPPMIEKVLWHLRRALDRSVRSSLHPSECSTPQSALEIVRVLNVEIVTNFSYSLRGERLACARVMTRCPACGHCEEFNNYLGLTRTANTPEQPADALSAAALRKLNVQPGDVMVLELHADYNPPDELECERVQEQIRRALGREDVPVLIPPPGCKLTMLSAETTPQAAPYSYRARYQDYEEEVHFATRAELIATLRSLNKTEWADALAKLDAEQNAANGGYLLPAHIAEGIAQLRAKDITKIEVEGVLLAELANTGRERCCMILPNGERCPEMARFWVGTNNVDNFTLACWEHGADVERVGDTARFCPEGWPAGVSVPPRKTPQSSLAAAENTESSTADAAPSNSFGEVVLEAKKVPFLCKIPPEYFDVPAAADAAPGEPQAEEQKQTWRELPPLL